MPASARHFALASLLALTALGAEPPAKAPAQTGPADPIEAARRDLKALPSLDRAGRTAPALDDVSIPLPELRATAPSAPVSSPSALNQDAKASSQGWLLDALDRGQGRAARRERDGVLPDSTRRAAAAANPLEHYLEQWISPQNRGILDSLGAEPGREKELRPRQESSWERRKPEGRNDFQAPPVSPGSLLEPRRPVNPYLQPDDTGLSEPPKPPAPAPSLRPAPAPVPSALPLSPGARPPEFPSLTSPREPERYVAPTAPLVDENKYFPQLRKF